jgi:uncharacterized protein (DUF1015 family)
VLGQDDKDRLLAGGDRNIVAVDLPHIPPKSLGPPTAYEQAARTLQSWLDDGTLVREQHAAIYVYHQTFEHAGRTYTRRKFFARVRLHPFEDGVILPHEQTFGGPKEDRLALMKATRCQLSPIFGLFTDPDDRTGTAFTAEIDRYPDAVATLEGVKNALWIVTDSAIIDQVASHLADRPIYIADGHHRYGTALNYRDWLAEQEGPLPDDHPAQYVMFVLGSMDDPGSLILPYHRVLHDTTIDALLDAWSPGVKHIEDGPCDLILHEGATGLRRRLLFTHRAILKTLEPDQCAPWHQLDAAYLHRYLIEHLLRAKLGSEPSVGYVKSEAAAIESAKDSSGVALLVSATPMAHLRAVSEAGGLMPQKSTYFYPKLATGFTINPL